MPIAPAPGPVAGCFQGKEHLYPVRVYFEDTDMTGVVYHANYLRFMERARSDMLARVGIHQQATFAAGGGYYAIADVALRYMKPARLDDDLIVRSQVRHVRVAACEIVQTIWRGMEQLTEGTVTAVFLSHSGRPQRQPAEWVATFNSLVAGEAPHSC